MTKNIITLTSRAQEKIHELLLNAPKNVCGLQVNVIKGGCTGFNYEVKYAQEIPAGAEILDGDFGTLVVHPAAVLYLLGAEMDYEDTPIHSKFTFSNPNESSRCGCGLSIAF